jgi:hypothetical protein
MSIYAVLIDTVSIQQYVFGGNKLKNNIGASYLIKDVYDLQLRSVVRSLYPGIIDLYYTAWRTAPDVIKIIEPDTAFEIGYIGGGNALLFFKQEDDAKRFIKEWTKGLLINAPGIIPAIACDKFDLNDFRESKDKLFRCLRKNKAEHVPQTVMQRHGITAECPQTGYSMEIWNENTIKPQYVSSVANAKIEAAKEANKDIEDKFSGELQDQYCFTDQLDKLGQSRGKDSHLAIVHIDGNGMGERFKNIEKLQDLRRLSASVEKATEDSVRLLIRTIVQRSSEIKKALGRQETGFERDNDNGREILPIRPIIIGGDDITFVSDGRLGIYFAKLFIDAFEKQAVSDWQPLSACAGIAITKTKYPFYRGYALSEKLCKNAKKVRKDKGCNGSWIDFHISYGGFSGSIEDIRKTHYRAVQGNLLMRPYRIGIDSDELSFDRLVENASRLLWKNAKDSNFPQSKIKELRSVLTLGEEACKTFVNESKARGRDIISEALFQNNKTPYFDMIELIEIYPDFELKVKEEAR